jgi:hypothetical protein
VRRLLPGRHCHLDGDNVSDRPTVAVHADGLPLFDGVEEEGRTRGGEAHILKIKFLLTLVHTGAYTSPVEYEWDEEKAAANLRKHGVDFADAALVLEDELALTMRDLYSENEARFVSIGRDP